MDKRTRVLNAFDGKPVDRPPVGFWFHFPAEECEGAGMRGCTFELLQSH